MRARQHSFADPEGAFLDHAAIERAIDADLGFPSLEEVDAAERRMQAALRRGMPGAVVVRSLSLEVA